MNNILIKAFGLLLFISVIVSACSAATSGQELAGTNWVLVSLDGSQVSAGLGGRVITLTLEDLSQASGSGGCNSFGAKYAANPSTGSITFSQLVSTLMACTDNGVSETEAAYFAALNSAEHYEVSATLLAISGGGHTLVFERA